jgi:hypothetical protein
MSNSLGSSASMANGFNGAAPMSNGFSSSSSVANGSVSSSLMTSTSSDPHQVWTPRSRADTNPVQQGTFQHRPNYSLDQPIGHSR